MTTTYMIDSVDLNASNAQPIADKYAVAYYVGGSAYAGGSVQDFSKIDFKNGYLPIYVPQLTDNIDIVAEDINKVSGTNIAFDIEVDAQNVSAWKSFFAQLSSKVSGKRFILYTPYDLITQYATGEWVPPGIWVPLWTVTNPTDLLIRLETVLDPTPLNPHNIPGIPNDEWEVLGQRAWQFANDTSLHIFGIPVDVSVIDSEMLNFSTESIYVVQPGDTLYGIANKLHVSFQDLLANNLNLLNSVAQLHGMANSQNGRWIFPGEKLVV